MKNRLKDIESDGRLEQEVWFEPFKMIRLSSQPQEDTYLEEDEESSQEEDGMTMANSAIKELNLWIVHTRTDLSRSLYSKIDEIEGIETLDIFSRYRFRIGIGKLFDANKVKHAVQQAVSDHVQNKKKYFSK